tara:strand:+ start:5251 stop:6075 length:825 start_codon:yes stop_codon:yes gene_type:complete
MMGGARTHDRGIRMRRVRLTLLSLMMATILQLSLETGLRAEPVKFQTDYSVRLIGIPVAYASFVSEVDGTSYKISGNLQTSAISDIILKTRGSVSVSGTQADDRLWASSFVVSYTSGKDAQKTEIEFREGNVKSSVNTPKRKASGAGWVPLSAGDMRSVLDPLSGLVFPGSSKVCPRSLPIFDGQSRVTLHLTPKGVRPFRTKGFSGDAIACSVRFEPKAGYRKGSSGIQYLTELKTMEIWFAKHEQGDLYAPVYAKVPTKIGQVIVAATRFGG